MIIYKIAQNETKVQMNILSPSLPHDCKAILCQEFQETEGIYSVNKDFRDFFYKKLQSETDQKIGFYQKNLILVGFPFLEDQESRNNILQMRKNENIVYNSCGGKKEFLNSKTVDYSRLGIDFGNAMYDDLNILLNKFEISGMEARYVALRVDEGITSQMAYTELHYSADSKALINTKLKDTSLKIVMRGITRDLRPFIILEKAFKHFSILLQYSHQKHSDHWLSYSVYDKTFGSLELFKS